MAELQAAFDKLDAAKSGKINQAQLAGFLESREECKDKEKAAKIAEVSKMLLILLKVE